MSEFMNYAVCAVWLFISLSFCFKKDALSGVDKFTIFVACTNVALNFFLKAAHK